MNSHLGRELNNTVYQRKPLHSPVFAKVHLLIHVTVIYLGVAKKYTHFLKRKNINGGKNIITG